METKENKERRKSSKRKNPMLPTIERRDEEKRGKEALSCGSAAFSIYYPPSPSPPPLGGGSGSAVPQE